MKILFENWRGFLNEEIEEDDTLDAKIRQALIDEGGAAGMEALEKHTGKNAGNIRAKIEEMDDVGEHPNGDYILSGGDVVIKEEKEEGDYVDTIELKEEDKIKGADGKECWDGYRYAGTDEDGKDKCVPSGKKKVNEEKSPAWQRKEGKNEEGGLNDDGRKSYEKDNPGSDLKAPVSKKTADKNPEGKAAGRRKSFCARMKGMKKKLTSKETASDPDSRINKSLRKWDC